MAFPYIAGASWLRLYKLSVVLMGWTLAVIVDAGEEKDAVPLVASAYVGMKLSKGHSSYRSVSLIVPMVNILSVVSRVPYESSELSSWESCDLTFLDVISAAGNVSDI